MVENNPFGGDADDESDRLLPVRLYHASRPACDVRSLLPEDEGVSFVGWHLYVADCSPHYRRHTLGDEGLRNAKAGYLEFDAKSLPPSDERRAHCQLGHGLDSEPDPA